MTEPQPDQEIVDAISHTLVFGDISPELAAVLAGHASIREYSLGRSIIRQGDPGDKVYILLEGAVRIYIRAADRQQTLVVLRPGESFGELALLDGGPRSASAEAALPCRVIVLDRTDVHAAIAQHPALMTAMLARIGGTLRRLTSQVGDIVFLDLSDRVAKLLMGLADEHAAAAAEGLLELDLDLTKSDIAAVIGRDSNTVDEILLAFERLGCIKVEAAHLLITKPDVLRQHAREGMSWADVAQRAFHDPLTRLANRALFTERLRQTLSADRGTDIWTGVVCLDVDGFRQLNETHGPVLADGLLGEVADRLRSCIRRPDNAARLGGDDFGVLLREMGSREIVISVAERIAASMAEAVTLGRVAIPLRATVALIIIPPDVTDADPDQVIRRAEGLLRAPGRGDGHVRVEDLSAQQAFHSAS